jgi:large subunit ribosomal protein L4
MKVAVVDLTNKKTGDLELPKTVFSAPIREDLMARMVTWQRDKARTGSHKAKMISEVSGRGQKPWAQKGTGRARAGTLKRTQDRGGGVVFGPVVRSHATSLPKKVRQAALKSALSVKAKSKKVIVLSEAKAKTHKTKDMALALKKMGLDNALIIFDGDALETNFLRAVNNIPCVNVLPQRGANVKDILAHDTLVLTQSAVKELEERLK